MANFHSYSRGGGHGRGRGYSHPPLEMFESRSGKPPMKTWIKPDPVSGCYKLHVCSIPKAWTEKIMRNVFEKIGDPVSVYLHKTNNHPKNWGFVEYQTYKEASSAIMQFNNNAVIDYIEVSFAKEKDIDDNYTDNNDSLLDLVNMQNEEAADFIQSSTPRNDKTLPQSGRDVSTTNIKITKKVINDHPLRTNLPLTHWCKLQDQSDEIKYIENAILKRILSIYENTEPTRECEVCGKKTNQSCENCTVSYCSSECQAKHWPSHSRTCISLNDNKPSNSPLDKNDGGETQKRGLTNGFSDEFNRSNRSRENIHSDKRFEEQQRYDRQNNDNERPNNRSSVRRTSRFTDVQNDRSNNHSDRNYSYSGNRHNMQGQSEGQRNMFEERKSKYLVTNKQSRADTESEDFWDATEQKEKIENVSQLSTKDRFHPNFRRNIKTEDSFNQGADVTLSSQVHKSQSVSSLVSPADDPPPPSLRAEVTLSSQVRESPSVSSLASPVVETPSLVNEPATSSSFDLEVGVEKKVMIMIVESPGVFYVHNCSEATEFHKFNEELEKALIEPSQFTAVIQGICASLFDDVWCRCQVTNLEPLTVFYIDYGNSEKSTVDKLFTIPEHLASRHPFAVKIKLAQGTPSEFINKNETDTSGILIKPVNKVDDYWVVQVAGVEYPPEPSQCLSESTSAPLAKQEKTQASVPAFPRLLPGDVYTKVCVRHRGSAYLAVIPVVNLPELEKFSARLQTEAEEAAPISPANTKCLALCPVTNLWCRGLIKQVEPLHVRFVDIGVVQTCNPANLRKISSELSSVPPFVVSIVPNKGSIEELNAKKTFSVKPLYKNEIGCWVVDIALPNTSDQTPPEDRSVSSRTPSVYSEKSSTPAPSVSSQQVKAVFPELLERDTFTKVLIMVVDSESSQGDTYFVGLPTYLQSLSDMFKYFLKATRNVLVSPQIGDIGLALYCDDWYRVRVVSLNPLTVFFIDYGNTEVLSDPEELRVCPDSHKDVIPLVTKVKLAPGTNEKYFNLPVSDIRIKPVSTLSDGTAVVQVEGEVYDEPVQTTNTQTPTVTLQTPVSNDVKQITEPEHIVDVLVKGEYPMAQFIPNKVDVARNLVFGMLFSMDIREVLFLAVNDEFKTVMENEPVDPDFMPRDGDLVVIKKSDEWHRAKVVELEGEQWASLVDLGNIVKLDQCKRLPQQFSQVPFLGSVMKLTQSVDLEQFKQIKDAIDIPISILKPGPEKILVQMQINDLTVKAELQQWIYEPLAWPLPLPSGALVSVTKVLKSNTLVVIPADNQMAIQTIQIECRAVASKEQVSSPKIGDYVTFLNDDDSVFYRTRIDSIDYIKNRYTLISIDELNTFEADLASLYPMPAALRKLPCRATPVVLKDVRNSDITDLAKHYITFIVKEEKLLRIEHDPQIDLVTLTIDGSGEVVNKKLEELLIPKIVTDMNGKFTLASVKDEKPPLNEELEFYVSHTNPLYLQNSQQTKRYYGEFYDAIVAYANQETSLYNPCEKEICIVNFEGEWYRATCLKETNTGVNSVMLLDFGDIVDMPTKDTRKMCPEFLTFPRIALGCKVLGLPKEITPELQARLDEVLKVNTVHRGTIEYEKDGHFYVRLPSVVTVLMVEGLIS